MTSQQIPSYSGVTINITNPTVNAGGFSPNSPVPTPNVQMCPTNEQIQPPAQAQQTQVVTNPIQPAEQFTNTKQEGLPQAYPPQYYLNNYNNFTPNGNDNSNNAAIAPQQTTNPPQTNTTEESRGQAQTEETQQAKINLEEQSAIQNPEEEDMTSSQEIINDLNTRSAKQKELEENGKKTRVIALTNEYIMSLENYLNNPNSEIRLMAAKEVLTRLDEDKSRYDDAALNALLNKMLQDPDKLIRIAALSAFSSQLASGNDYTVELLTKIQQDPDADKDDVVQAADCLLKMAADTEIKYTPAPTPAPKTVKIEEQKAEK